MKLIKRVVFGTALIAGALCLSGCDPQVYGNVGLQSGCGSGPHLTGSISVGGRIH